MTESPACPSCFDRPPFPEARFCTTCGWVLRQPCPYCANWLLVGGADLESGRCPGCRSRLRVCTNEFCRRINPVERSRCGNPGCGDRLPPVAVPWATTNGPADGSGLLPPGAAWTVRSGRPVGPGLLGVVCDDRPLGVFARGLKDLASGSVLGLRGAPAARPSPVLGGGGMWVARQRAVLRMTGVAAPLANLAAELAAHSASDSFWLGIDAAGNVHRWRLAEQAPEQIGSLRAPASAPSLVADSDEVFGFSGEEVIVATESGVSIGASGGTPVGAFLSGGRHLLVRSGSALRLARFDGSGREEWRSDAFPGTRVVGTAAFDGAAWFLSEEEGRFFRASLRGGRVEPKSVFSNRTVFASYGVPDRGSLRFFVVARIDRALRVSLVDPESGHEEVLAERPEGAGASMVTSAHVGHDGERVLVGLVSDADTETLYLDRAEAQPT